MEPTPGDEERTIVVDSVATQTALLQIRNLLQHTVDNKGHDLATMEEQIASLLSLYYHYAKAGAVLDKSENQANVMRSKMELLYRDIEVRQGSLPCPKAGSHHLASSLCQWATWACRGAGSCQDSNAHQGQDGLHYRNRG
jgi:hypothetical protein